jgi:hypothetical protein
MITLRSAVMSLVIGLFASLISGYLFYLEIINLNLMLYLVFGSIFIVVILITQANSYEIEIRLTNSERVEKLLIEKLKIYEQLIEVKVELKELQKEVFGR